MGNKAGGGGRDSRRLSSRSSRKSGLFASRALGGLFKSFDEASVRQGLQGAFSHVGIREEDYYDEYDDVFHVREEEDGESHEHEQHKQHESETESEGEEDLSLLDDDDVDDVAPQPHHVSRLFQDLPPIRGYKFLSYVYNRHHHQRRRSSSSSSPQISFLRVLHVETDKVYAMKIVRVNAFSMKDVMQVRKEVERLSEMMTKTTATTTTTTTTTQNANIVRLVESFELLKNPLKEESSKGNNRYFCLVMECAFVVSSSSSYDDVDGLLRKSHVMKKPLPAPLTLTWFLQLLSLFRFLSEGNVFHRHLRPENVLLVSHRKKKKKEIIRSRRRRREEKRKKLSILFTKKKRRGVEEEEDFSSGILKVGDFGLGSLLLDRNLAYQKTADESIMNTDLFHGYGNVVGGVGTSTTANTNTEGTITSDESPSSLTLFSTLDDGQPEIKGSIIFSSPEVLAHKKEEENESSSSTSSSSIDARSDMWSLGFLLHKMFFGISEKTYDGAIQKLLSILAESEELSGAFCDRFGDDDIAGGGGGGSGILEEVNCAHLMAFFADEDLVWGEVVAPAAEKVPCVAAVLRKMICTQENRLSPSVIAGLPQVQTWKLLLGLCESEEEERRAMSELDPESLWLVLRESSGKGNFATLKRCLAAVLENADELLDLADEANGRAVTLSIFKHRRELVRNSDFSWLALRVFCLLIRSSSGSEEAKQTVLRRLSVGIRTVSFLPVLSRFVKLIAPQAEKKKLSEAEAELDPRVLQLLRGGSAGYSAQAAKRAAVAAHVGEEREETAEEQEQQKKKIQATENLWGVGIGGKWSRSHAPKDPPNTTNSAQKNKKKGDNVPDEETQQKYLFEFLEAISVHSPSVARQFGHLCIESAMNALLQGKNGKFEALVGHWLPAINDGQLIETLLTMGGEEEEEKKGRVVEFFNSKGENDLSDAWKTPEIGRRLIELSSTALERLAEEMEASFGVEREEDRIEEEGVVVVGLSSAGSRIGNVLRLLVRLCFTPAVPESVLRFDLSPEAKNATLVLRSGREGDVELIGDGSELTFSVIQPRKTFLRSSVVLHRTSAAGGGGQEEGEEEEEENDNRVIVYYEMTVLEGGMNDYIQLGYTIGGRSYLLEPSRFSLLSPGFFGKGQVTNALGSSLYPLHSGSICGVGLTENHCMFMTLNGKLITREIAVSAAPDSPIRAEIVAMKNRHFVASVNFGASPFDFRFAGTSDRKSASSERSGANLKVLAEIPSLMGCLDRLEAGAEEGVAGLSTDVAELIYVLKEGMESGNSVIPGEMLASVLL